MTKPPPGVAMEDYEADCFATHLLMPSQWVREELGKLIQELSRPGPFRRPGAKYVEVGDLVNALAVKFQVEPWRMTARLIEMKLLDHGYIRGDKV